MPFDNVPQSDTILLLRQASLRLAQPGVWMKDCTWRHDHSVPGGFRACAGGMIEHVAHQYEVPFWDAQQALSSTVPYPGVRLVNFNDHPDTTLPMILAWFDRAIAHELTRV